MKDSNTEEKILAAARQVFIEKGYDGARMQEIANRASINKALLHYYFRSKEKLFMKIFEEAFKQFIPKVGSIIMSDLSFDLKLKKFIETYINLLLDNPYLPIFIINEISKNPLLIENLLPLKYGELIDVINVFLIEEYKMGNIRKIDAKQLLMNVVSLCIFPFAGQPILMAIFGMKQNEYLKLLNERKEVVYNVISLWIKP